MSIRKAEKKDVTAIRHLLLQLDYPAPQDFIEEKLERMISHPDQALIVYELDGNAVAFISMHFVPQIALAGDFAIISYFAVNEKYLGRKIGTELELYAIHLAKERDCDRIQVHCHIRREEAHKFYERRGYTETRKYYTKQLYYHEDF